MVLLNVQRKKNNDKPFRINADADVLFFQHNVKVSLKDDLKPNVAD